MIFHRYHHLQWQQQITVSQVPCQKQSCVDFHLHVQFFSNFMQLEHGSSKFLGNSWTFLQKIFHRNRATLSMKPWTCLTSHRNALVVGPSNGLFPSSLPTPQSRITHGLWSALNTTNGIYKLHLSNICLGEFPQCFDSFVLSSSMARYRRTKPLSFLKYTFKHLGHNSFTSEAEVFFILTICLHKVQLYKEEKKKKKYRASLFFSPNWDKPQWKNTLLTVHVSSMATSAQFYHVIRPWLLPVRILLAKSSSDKGKP